MLVPYDVETRVYRFPRTTRALCALVACLLLAASAGGAAQVFVFASDRVAPGDGRSDLFLYRDGSELRLTATPDRAEYDPSPSPDGLVGYAETDFALDAAEGAWSWRYRVMDASGRERDSWEVPGSAGRFRPAGGFALAWLPDGRSFLAQGWGADERWEVLRFVLGARRPVRVAAGFEIRLAPDGARFATDRDGLVVVVAVADGRERVIAGGRPLGWAGDDALLIERDDALLLVPLDDPGDALLIGDSGPYGGLRWSPDGERYAYTTVGEVPAVFVHDRDHRYLGSFATYDFVTDLDWLDDDRLLLGEVAPDGDAYLALLDPATGEERPLVASVGLDFVPRRLSDRGAGDGATP